MIRRMTRAYVAPLGLVVAGCTTVSPFMGPTPVVPGFEYSVGQSRQAFAATPPAVETALRSAMDDLRIRPSPSRHDAGTVSVEGTTADNRHVVVTLEPTPGSTRVRTRVGWLGDEPLSRALMDRLAIRLGAFPTSAVPVEPQAASATDPAPSRAAGPDSGMNHNPMDGGFRTDGGFLDSPVP